VPGKLSLGEHRTQHRTRSTHIILLLTLVQHSRKVLNDLNIYAAGSDNSAGEAILFLIIEAAHDSQASNGRSRPPE
jgi:hypothetical protein